MLDRISALVAPYAEPWAQLKLRIGDLLQMSPDALHVHAGLIFLALFALVFRRRLFDRRAMLCLLAITLINEAMDLTLEGMGSTEATLGAGLHDLVNTMLAPVVLCVASWLLRRRSSRRAASGALQVDEIA